MDDSKKIAEKHVFKNSGFGKYRDFCGFAIGFDDFNLAPTFGKTMTLQSSRADTHHLPVVFIRSEKE